MGYVENRVYKFQIFDDYSDKIIACFTTRNGGVSNPPFNTMNLGFNTSDDKNSILNNMDIVLGDLNLSDRVRICNNQIHNDKIQVVDNKFVSNYKDGKLNNIMEATDGIIITSNNVVGFTYYADCTSVFIYDPTQNIIGIAHSGWKGTTKRISKRMIEIMKNDYGSKVSELLCAIGPTAEKCCYEVDEIVKKHFEESGFDINEFLTYKSNEKYMLSMSNANLQVLLESGIQMKNIEISNICTICNSDEFFSYRRDGISSGRMAGIIALK